jgi:hypothetical protein
MIRRRSALLALPGLALLAGCAPGALRLAGGKEEGGIGGTGIFGSVTGLGSLRVNGLRLETRADTAIESLARDGAPVLPGDVVAAEAVRVDGGLRATRLAVFHPLIGPAEFGPDGTLEVLGTPVAVPAGTPVRDADGAPLAVLPAGATVAVSGLWRGEGVVAGSLRLLDGPPRAELRGQLRRMGFGLAVGRTRLDRRGLPGLEPERFVVIQGRQGPAGLVVEGLAERPLAVFSGAVGALSVEGFVALNATEPGFHLSGFGLPLDSGSARIPPVGQRQLMLGRYGQAFRIEAGLPLPAEAPAREAALGAPAAEAAIRRWLAG